MGELTIVAPESKPASGGVADYTLRLIEYLPSPDQISIVAPPFDWKTRALDSAKVLLQYSAYGFDRFGYPRELIRTLINWKQRTGGRLVVMFHEIWTFWPVTNKNYFVQLLHRRALKRLLRYTDVAFTSTAGQVEHLRALDSGTPIHLLPVGTNIRRSPGAPSNREPGTAVLFGLQSSRISTLQRMATGLRQLASSGRIGKLITAGASSGSSHDAIEFKLLNELRLTNAFEQRGALPEEAISRLLLSASFGIFGQSELSYTKSGTFMAYAAHELNIIAEPASKNEPACWVIAPAELIAGISETELRIRAEKLRHWQQQTSSWETIAAKLADALGLGSRNSATIAGASR